MKRIMLDTNVLIALFKGDQQVADIVSTYDRVLIPTVVLGEFKAGLALDVRQGHLLRQTLNQFLDAPAVEVVSITERTTETYALVYKVLKEKGTPIPQNDLWIAAMALDSAVELYSRDRHFLEIPLLKLMSV